MVLHFLNTTILLYSIVFCFLIVILITVKLKYPGLFQPFLKVIAKSLFSLFIFNLCLVVLNNVLIWYGVNPFVITIFWQCLSVCLLGYRTYNLFQDFKILSQNHNTSFFELNRLNIQFFIKVMILSFFLVLCLGTGDLSSKVALCTTGVFVGESSVPPIRDVFGVLLDPELVELLEDGRLLEENTKKGIRITIPYALPISSYEKCLYEIAEITPPAVVQSNLLQDHPFLIDPSFVPQHEDHVRQLIAQPNLSEIQMGKLKYCINFIKAMSIGYDYYGDPINRLPTTFVPILSVEELVSLRLAFGEQSYAPYLINTLIDTDIVMAYDNSVSDYLFETQGQITEMREERGLAPTPDKTEYYEINTREGLTHRVLKREANFQDYIHNGRSKNFSMTREYLVRESAKKYPRLRSQEYIKLRFFKKAEAQERLNKRVLEWNAHYEEWKRQNPPEL